MRFQIVISILLGSIFIDAQAQSIFGELTLNFAFEVKQVDEFIERFNNNPNTLANIESIKAGAGPLSRKDNLLSIFNHTKKDWSIEKVEHFINEVIERKTKSHLDFYDNNWYAALDCTFIYLQQKIVITLILQNQGNAREGSKWVIVSILPNNFIEKNCQPIPRSLDVNKILNPMSHGTRFVGLRKALNDKKNLQNYFDPTNPEEDFIGFEHAILNNKLSFVQVNSITYHFLQLENWGFTLNFFPRESKNAGWLISSLQKMDANQKRGYKMKFLNL